MSDEDDKICPLCCEDLDISDQNFLPCKCGYQARRRRRVRLRHRLERRELGVGVGGHHRAVAAEGAVVGRRAVPPGAGARRLGALEGRRARRRQGDEEDG